MRLNKYIREQIARAVTTAAFADRKAAVADSSARLALRAYNQAYTQDQRKKMSALVDAFSGLKDFSVLPSHKGMRVNVGGQQIDLVLPEALPFPHEHEYGHNVVLTLVGDDPFGAEIIAQGNAEDDCEAEFQLSRRQVLATLNTFHTPEKLRAAWPEIMSIAEPILEQHGAAKPVNVPALKIASLNEALGLPVDPPADERVKEAA